MQNKDENGQLINFEQANGRESNYYRHNTINYNQILNNIRAKQDYVKEGQAEKAAVEHEVLVEKYRDQYVNAIEDSQKKGQLLKTLMRKAGVSTATALSNLLDTWSIKIKDIANLDNSQRTLQSWNDTYRVQRELVKKLLVSEGVSKEVIKKVNTIYSTRSVNKAVEMGSDFLNLEKSEILKFIKSAVRYSKLGSGETW